MNDFLYLGKGDVPDSKPFRDVATHLFLSYCGSSINILFHLLTLILISTFLHQCINTKKLIKQKNSVVETVRKNRREHDNTLFSTTIYWNLYSTHYQLQREK